MLIIRPEVGRTTPTTKLFTIRNDMYRRSIFQRFAHMCMDVCIGWVHVGRKSWEGRYLFAQGAYAPHPRTGSLTVDPRAHTHHVHTPRAHTTRRKKLMARDTELRAAKSLIRSVPAHTHTHTHTHTRARARARVTPCLDTCTSPPAHRRLEHQLKSKVARTHQSPRPPPVYANVNDNNLWRKLKQSI